MRIGIISDTHRYLNPAVHQHFAGVAHILHAGDVEDDDILTELALIAPLTAVSGNVDGSPNTRRPLRQELALGGLTIGMTHGHYLDVRDYNRSALEFFAESQPRLIVHGHTHIARFDRLADAWGPGVDAHILNPGAAGRARFRSTPSLAILQLPQQAEAASGPPEFTVEFISL